MDEKKRHKVVIAYANRFYAVCPFKACGHRLEFTSIVKGELVRCLNCRKEFKIKKVVC